MPSTDATGKYFTINHVILFTGLTDRTIRSYIAAGLLQGKKINGLWHFTPEQVDAFIRHPAVWPSIQSKKNSIVYNFLLDTQKTSHEACVILDLPGDDPRQAAEFFCYTINNSDLKNLHFSFDSVSGAPRVILRGRTSDVMDLLERYYHR